MTSKKLICLSLVAGGATLALTGCAVRERAVVRVGPGPGYYAEERVVVRERPPALREEVIIERPSPRHVWIAGHWYWRGNGWVWVGGCWQLPPRHGVVWFPGHWTDRHGTWEWIPGHWR